MGKNDVSFKKGVPLYVAGFACIATGLFYLPTYFVSSWYNTLSAVVAFVAAVAINRARKVYVHNNNNKDKEIIFTVDDILNSKIKDKSFDYVFDRGVFMFCQSKRGQFISNK